MSKWSDFTDGMSRFGQWLERPLGNLVEDIRELYAEMREKRRRRREKHDSRRARSRMRRKIFGRTLLGMAIFSVVYWGLAYAALFASHMFNFLEEIVVLILRLIPGEQYLADVRSAVFPFYCTVMILWPLVSLFRAAGYLDIVYFAADSILDRERQMPELPAQINDIDSRLRGVRIAVAEKEQLAREAEQRKNDLVIYLAHDLKTPLSSVIGYLTLLEEVPDMPVEQRAKYTSITLDKACRLEQLINEFFDITRFSLQTVELENNRMDMSLMLMQLADEFYPVLEQKNLTVNLTVPPHLEMIGDADKLMRVFDNLLRNAVSYSYEGTRIALVARRMTGNRVEIICRNTGDRISPQSLERLFEKFFRVDSSRRSSTGGAGLGLAIARHIVELHGGSITAESSTEYTQFRIVLPVNGGQS